jgi:hypothetical protein
MNMANTVSKIISDETLNRIIQIESAGNPDARAPSSSAAGLGQFILGTWNATVRKHRPDLFRNGAAPARFGLATAALQLEILARFTEDNAQALGAGFTDGDLYLAHFLGLGDARKLFKAPPGDAAASHVSAAAVAANRSILSNKTCAQVRAWAQASMLSRWDKAGRKDWVKKYAGVEPAPLPDVPPVNLPAPIPVPAPNTAGGVVGGTIATTGAVVVAHETQKSGAGNGQVAIVIVCGLVIALAVFFVIRHWREA